MYSEKILIGIFAVINIIAFLVVAYDKRKSVRGEHAERIPEGLLFFMATAFGSAGVYASMLLFRHKTKRWYFQLGIPLLILENIAALYVLRELLIAN